MRKVISWAIGLVLAQSAAAFVGVVNTSGEVRHWALDPVDARVRESSVNRSTRAIVYRLDAAGSPASNAAAEHAAIRAAFDQWQAVSGTRLKFEEGAMRSAVTDINNVDHTNTLHWTRSLFINGGRDNLSGTLALTYVTSFRTGNVIFDSDTVFNGVEFGWTTDFSESPTDKIFVEAIALHEIGHLIGLEHSPVGGATMLVGGERGVNVQVGLSADEGTAARGIYGTPTTLRGLGQIKGRVRASGAPVFGAAVFAENGLGMSIAGTVSRTDGTYDLPAVPPGAYTVRVAPLDPAFGVNYLVRGIDIAGTYDAAQTEFLPAPDRAVTLAAAATSTVDFEVSGGTPLRIVRLLRPAPDLSGPSFNDRPVSVPQGGPTVFVGVLLSSIPAGETTLTVTGDGLTAGAVEVRRDVFPGMTLVAMPVTIAGNATPGLRTFRVQVGGQVAWAHGFLEIQTPFPDVNADSLDDGFQRRYWARFTVPEAGPTADPDQDGFDNDWESRTGSDPTNRLSANFQIESVRVTAEGARVRSETAKGRKFQLLTRDTIPDAPWQAVGAPIAAAGSSTEFMDPSAKATVRFYRVQMVP